MNYTSYLRLTPEKRFLLLYIVYISALFILIEQPYLKNLLHINSSYSILVTKISATLMESFTTVIHRSNFIYLSNATLDIKFGCNGLESIILYISAIFAYPASIKHKIYGLIIGFIIINIINILRILVLGHVLLNYTEAFDVMHNYVTQNIMIVFVFLLFILYLRLIDKNESTN